ncbi:MAG TPA: arsenate reductase (glutaredoxin) [Daejeonella sp.]|nr:arsenate reductase (glutaredoxin) [Daejeonella sp.]
MIKIYHNTRCSKSRSACSILAEKGIPVEIIEYLKTPPSQAELKNLLKMLGMKAEDIVRKNEPLFKEKYQGKSFSEDEWIRILSENPVLIQRPIIVKGNKAVIGRSEEQIQEILE